MTLMALMALFGLLVVILLSCFFSGRASARRARVRSQLEDEVALKVRQAQETDVNLVNQVLNGISVDQALGDYHRGRAGILTLDRPDKPWDWCADDLDAWRKRELQRRLEEVNRGLLLPAVGSAVLTVALTVTAITVTYQFMVAQPAAGGSGSSSATVGTPSTPPAYLPAVALPTPAMSSPADTNGDANGNGKSGSTLPPADAKAADSPPPSANGSNDSTPAPTSITPLPKETQP